MSACQKYQENAWKRGNCRNCFLSQAEHLPVKPVPRSRQAAIVKTENGAEKINENSQNVGESQEKKPSPNLIKENGDQEQTDTADRNENECNVESSTPKPKQPLKPPRNRKPSPASGKPKPVLKPIARPTCPPPKKPDLPVKPRDRSESRERAGSQNGKSAQENETSRGRQPKENKSVNKNGNNSSNCIIDETNPDRNIYSQSGEYSVPCDVESTGSSTVHYKTPTSSREVTPEAQGTMGYQTPISSREVTPDDKKSKQSNSAVPLSPTKILEKTFSDGKDRRSSTERRHDKVPVDIYKVNKEPKKHMATPYRVIDVVPNKEVVPYTIVDVSSAPPEEDPDNDPPGPPVKPPPAGDKRSSSLGKKVNLKGVRADEVKNRSGSVGSMTTVPEENENEEMEEMKDHDNHNESEQMNVNSDKEKTNTKPLPLKPRRKDRNKDARNKTSDASENSAKKNRSGYEPVEIKSAQSHQDGNGNTIPGDCEIEDDVADESVEQHVSFFQNSPTHIQGTVNEEKQGKNKSKNGDEFRRMVHQRRSFGKSPSFEAKLSASIEQTLDLALGKKKSKSASGDDVDGSDQFQNPTYELKKIGNGGGDADASQIEEEDLHHDPKEMAVMKEKFGKKGKQSAFSIKKLLTFGGKEKGEKKRKASGNSQIAASRESIDKGQKIGNSTSCDDLQVDVENENKRISRKLSKESFNEVFDEEEQKAKTLDEESLKSSKESLLSDGKGEPMELPTSKSKKSPKKENKKFLKETERKHSKEEKEKSKQSFFARLENIRKSGRKKSVDKEKLKKTISQPVVENKGKLLEDLGMEEDEGKDAEKPKPEKEHVVEELKTDDEMFGDGGDEEIEEVSPSPQQNRRTRVTLERVLSRPKSSPPQVHVRKDSSGSASSTLERQKSSPRVEPDAQPFKASMNDVLLAKSKLQQRSGTLTEEALAGQPENLYDIIVNGNLNPNIMTTSDKRSSTSSINDLPTPPPVPPSVPSHQGKLEYEPVIVKDAYEPVIPVEEIEGTEGEEPVYMLYEVAGRAKTHTPDFSHTSSGDSSQASTIESQPGSRASDLGEYLEPIKLGPSKAFLDAIIPLPKTHVRSEPEYDVVEPKHRISAASETSSDASSLSGHYGSALDNSENMDGETNKVALKSRSLGSNSPKPTGKRGRRTRPASAKARDPYVMLLRDGRNHTNPNPPYFSIIDSLCHIAALNFSTLEELYKRYQDQHRNPIMGLSTADLSIKNMELGDEVMVTLARNGDHVVQAKLRSADKELKYTLLVSKEENSNGPDCPQHYNIFSAQSLLSEKMSVKRLPNKLHQELGDDSDMCSVHLLKYSSIKTITRYFEELKSNHAVDNQEFERTVCLILLQIVDGLTHLQDCKHAGKLTVNNVLVITLVQSVTPVVVLNPVVSTSPNSADNGDCLNQEDVKLLLQTVLNIAFPGIDTDWSSLILFSAHHSIGIQKLLDILESFSDAFLTLAKALLEFLLFGPRDSDLKTVFGEDSEVDDTFQLWLEIERAKFVSDIAHKVTRNDKYITHEDACHIAFLCNEKASRYIQAAQMFL